MEIIPFTCHWIPQDEEEPEKILDPNAVKPAGWLDEEPELIPSEERKTNRLVSGQDIVRRWKKIVIIQMTQDAFIIYSLPSYKTLELSSNWTAWFHSVIRIEFVPHHWATGLKPVCQIVLIWLLLRPFLSSNIFMKTCISWQSWPFWIFVSTTEPPKRGALVNASWLIDWLIDR